ncbi:MAG: BrnA antitoxin family protein [Arenicellales bacterium]
MKKQANPEMIDSTNPEWTKEDIIKSSRPDKELIILSKRSVGRPLSDNPKQRTTIFLDREIMDFFKADGKGWQTRINAVLREHAKSHNH